MILRNESYCFCTRQCHVTIPYMEPLSFFGHCHVSFPYMELLSFFGGIVQLILKLVLSDSFVKTTTQLKGASADGKMAAIMLQTIPSFYTKLSEKSLFFSANVFEKYIVCKDNRRNKGVDKMPSIAKKRLLRKKYKTHLFSSFQKTKTTQTSGSVFAERFEKVKKTKFELDLIKIVDCF